MRKFKDTIQVGDVLFTSMSDQREVIYISEQDIKYPIVTVDPHDHCTVATYTADGKFMENSASASWLLPTIKKGVLLMSERRGEDYFVVMVTDYNEHENHVFSGTVVYDTLSEHRKVGKTSDIWAKSKFTLYTAAIRLRN